MWAKKNSKDPKLLGDNIFWIKEKICGIKKLVKKDLAQKMLINFFQQCIDQQAGAELRNCLAKKVKSEQFAIIWMHYED